jgi:pyridoxamine 5'-phosphate oxidase
MPAEPIAIPTPSGGGLPEVLPADPFPMVKAWFDEAVERQVQPNPNAMTLATVDADGWPSARMVLCKSIDPVRGCLMFYTNYTSRKAAELAANPRAAAVFHWDTLQRQVRVVGPVTRSPEAESDEYFASRPLLSRLCAWISEQSQPIASRQVLTDRFFEILGRFPPVDGKEPVVPRPEFWGGYRLWAQRIELWTGVVGRLHDRAAWTRGLIAGEVDGVAGYRPDPARPWSATRLQP